jgi:hypothetical protein
MFHGPAGQQCVESKPRSYEATAGPLAPGTRALVKERAIPRGHYVSGPTRPRSRAPSHAREGRRQLRTTYQRLGLGLVDGHEGPQQSARRADDAVDSGKLLSPTQNLPRLLDLVGTPAADVAGPASARMSRVRLGCYDSVDGSGGRSAGEARLDRHWMVTWGASCRHLHARSQRASRSEPVDRGVAMIG